MSVFRFSVEVESPDNHAESDPVLYRDHDAMRDYEWPMGVEDARLARRDDGLWVLTYTAFDTRTARLCIATSPDLRRWTKQGLAFGDFADGRYWMCFGEPSLRRRTD